MATENQTNVLLAILTNDYTAFNGGLPAADRPFDGSDWDVWSNDLASCHGQVAKALPCGKALSATVSTLVQAGLVRSSGETIRFTEEGYKLARAAWEARKLA